MEGLGKAENNQMNKIVWKTEKLQHFREQKEVASQLVHNLEL